MTGIIEARPETLAARNTDLLNDITFLRRFIPFHQLDVMVMNMNGPDGAWIREKLQELAAMIRAMPKTYEQDGKGREALVYLHYFGGSADFFITERDKLFVQHQAFGAATYGGDQSLELGYISLVELCRHPLIELDLHFAPCALAQVYAEREALDEE